MQAEQPYKPNTVERMIDLHCHLLPGIDDGPDTLEESLELCRIAVADGISLAIVTPHIHPGRWENTRRSIAEACSALQRALELHDIPLRLGFAGEVRLTDRIMQQVADDDIPFYGSVDGYKVMLLEFPHSHLIPGGEKLARWLVEVTVLASDGHNDRVRPPVLRQTFDYIASQYGEKRAQRLMLETPAAIIQG
jgi:protein-tyrosine phosphatase